MKSKIKSLIIASILVVLLTLILSSCDGFFSCMHEWDEGEVLIDPTEEKSGLIVYVCTLCEETKVKKIDHLCDWGEGVVYTDPETEDTYRLHTCSICSDTKIVPLPKCEHEWGEGLVLVEPTCKEGEMGYLCALCEAPKKETIPPVKEHEYDEGTVTKEPTCQEMGEITYTCITCQDKKTEALPINEENHVSNNVGEPKVDETGRYQDVECACGYTATIKDESYIVVTSSEELNQALIGDTNGKTIVLNGNESFGTLTIYNAENTLITSINGATVDSVLFSEGEEKCTVNNLTIENLSFVGARVAIEISENANTKINGLTIRNCTQITDSALSFFSKKGSVSTKNVTIDSCQIEGVTNNAVALQFGTAIENLSVENCTFKNVAENCIYISADGNTGSLLINNNVATSFGSRFANLKGISEGTVVISSNTLSSWINEYEVEDIVRASNTTATYQAEDNTLDEIVLDTFTKVDGETNTYSILFPNVDQNPDDLPEEEPEETPETPEENPEEIPETPINETNE